MANAQFPEEPRAYAGFVAELVKSGEPATHAMYVVAIENLRPTLAATESACKKLGKPFIFDDILVNLHNRLMEVQHDPIRSRRLLWYLVAHYIIRLDNMTTTNPLLVGAAVDIWSSLIEGARYIPRLLSSNVVWSQTEKSWFDDLKTESDVLEYAVTFAMPRIYRGHPQIRAIVETNGILLLP